MAHAGVELRMGVDVVEEAAQVVELQVHLARVAYYRKVSLQKQVYSYEQMNESQVSSVRTRT